LGNRPVEPPDPARVVLLEVSSVDDARAAVADGALPIVVVAYRGEGLVEKARAYVAALGQARPLIVFNQVPEKGERAVRMKAIPALADRATILGVVPEDRVLRGMGVGDLARSLEAVVLSAEDGVDRPVEAVMIAAMSDEGAEEYFRSVTRKAVVASGDRPDIHLPALATDTSCLVLTEGYDPDPTVLDLAEDQGVPLLKVQPDTLATLERISDALAGARFAQRYKVPRALDLVEKELDHDTLLGALAPGAARRVQSAVATDSGSGATARPSPTAEGEAN
jgi:BioD-like phosphotransacetylase family protein